LHLYIFDVVDVLCPCCSGGSMGNFRALASPKEEEEENK